MTTDDLYGYEARNTVTLIKHPLEERWLAWIEGWSVENPPPLAEGSLTMKRLRRAKEVFDTYPGWQTNLELAETAKRMAECALWEQEYPLEHGSLSR